MQGVLGARSWLVLALIGGCARPARVAPPAPPAAPTEQAPAVAEPAPTGSAGVAPVEISAGVLHGLLDDGEVDLAHDDAGLPTGRLGYRICLDREGTASLAPWPVEPAYAELDRRIQARIATWRFRPFVRDDVAVAACSELRVDIATPGPAPGSSSLLPPRLIELPRPTIVSIPRPPAVARPPTPGVGIVVRCTHGPADAGPVAALVQASGDEAADAQALHERWSRRADDPDPDALRCVAVATIAGVVPSGPDLPSPPGVAPSAPAPGERVVAPRVFEQERIVGDPRIFPSPEVKVKIAASGKALLVIPVKVCVGVDGKVSGVSMLKSSGFLAYDIELMNAIGGWRYRPFTIDGKPAPVCSIVQFMYRQT